jgi:hypothetical protein
LKNSGSSHRLEVRAFLILERAAGSKGFGVSVLLQAEGRSIGKTSLGSVAEGQEILPSLRWDQQWQCFVEVLRLREALPFSGLSFRSPGAADPSPLAEFLMTQNCVLNSGVIKNKELDECKN